jgi:transcriptional regulator GlxA family with amidase domain
METELFSGIQHWLQTYAVEQPSVSQMAAIGGLQARTFLRRFEKATGLKPTEYTQRLRVGKAREMLEYTNQTVDRIARTAGYEDPGSFCKVFKKVTGLKPENTESASGCHNRRHLQVANDGPKAQSDRWGIRDCCTHELVRSAYGSPPQ